MIGTVVQIDEKNGLARIQLAGTQRCAIASFTEVRNATPARLDDFEIVDAEVEIRGDRLVAKNVRVLTGKAEVRVRTMPIFGPRTESQKRHGR